MADRSPFSFAGPLFLGDPMKPTFIAATPMGRVEVRIDSATEATVDHLRYETRNLFEGMSNCDGDAGKGDEYLTLHRVPYTVSIQFKLEGSTWSKSFGFYARVYRDRLRRAVTLDVSNPAREAITSMLSDMVQQLVVEHPHVLTMAQASTLGSRLADIDKQRQALEAERAEIEALLKMTADGLKECEALMRSSEEQSSQ